MSSTQALSVYWALGLVNFNMDDHIYLCAAHRKISYMIERNGKILYNGLIVPQEVIDQGKRTILAYIEERKRPVVVQPDCVDSALRTFLDSMKGKRRIL